MRLLLVRRVGTICRILLAFPHPPLAPKPNSSEFTFLSMTGKNLINSLTKHCLLSLYHSWTVLPKLQIVSDGSLTTSELAEALAWWPGEKEFSTWEDSVLYHQQRGRESLVRYAKASSIMGRKFAVITHFGEEGPILWCDADILWFKELQDLPVSRDSSAFPGLKLAEDNVQSYDEELLENGLEHLRKPPYFNAGLVFLKGNLFQVCNLDRYINIVANQSYSSWLAEQTLFAEALHQLKGDFWSREKIALLVDDRLSLAPTYLGKNWIARHYVGPVRYIFYRDALALKWRWLKAILTFFR